MMTTLMATTMTTTITATNPTAGRFFFVFLALEIYLSNFANFVYHHLFGQQLSLMTSNTIGFLEQAGIKTICSSSMTLSSGLTR